MIQEKKVRGGRFERWKLISNVTSQPSIKLVYKSQAEFTAIAKDFKIMNDFKVDRMIWLPLCLLFTFFFFIGWRPPNRVQRGCPIHFPRDESLCFTFLIFALFV